MSDEQTEAEKIAEAAADAAQDFVDQLENGQILDSAELWEFVYNFTLAVQTKP